MGMLNNIPGIISTFWVIIQATNVLNNVLNTPWILFRLIMRILFLQKTEITEQKWKLFLMFWISFLLYEYFRYFSKRLGDIMLLLFLEWWILFLNYWILFLIYWISFLQFGFLFLNS